MILLDTNVLSELMRPRPRATITKWLDERLEGTVWISTITLAEIQFGIAILPEGHKRTDLAERAAELFSWFEATTASFDALAAREFALVAAERRKRGRPIDHPDAQVAAIALSMGCILATMNTKDFEGIDGLNVVDPSITLARVP